MNLLVIGDIIGKPGREATKKALKILKKEGSFDVVIANGENLAHGSGMTPKTYQEMRKAGINFFTSGNHILKKKDIIPILNKEEETIIRPANFPPGNPGVGCKVLKVGEKKLLVINLIGRVFMSHHYDCPFRVIDTILKEAEAMKLDGIVVDFHAEATSEKTALRHYLDGRVSALWGTHTHVPTADAHVTKKGLAYITDLGMVGPMDSVIGDKKENIIESFLMQNHFKLEIPSGRCLFSGAVIEITSPTRSASILPIQLKID